MSTDRETEAGEPVPARASTRANGRPELNSPFRRGTAIPPTLRMSPISLNSLGHSSILASSNPKNSKPWLRRRPTVFWGFLAHWSKPGS